MLTAAERRARIEADTKSAIEKAIQAANAKMAKELSKLDDEAQESALREKKGELVKQEQEFMLGIFQTLGITIPEKGMTIKQEIKMEHGPNGSIMCSITIPDKVVSTPKVNADGSPVTRAPRGSGTGRHTITEIDNLDSWSFAGVTAKPWSQLLAALDVDVKGDAPTRKIVSWALTEKSKANEVVVKFTDGSEDFLGDLIAKHFGATETASPEAPATESVTNVPPPPPPVMAGTSN